MSDSCGKEGRKEGRKEREGEREREREKEREKKEKGKREKINMWLSSLKIMSVISPIWMPKIQTPQGLLENSREYTHPVLEDDSSSHYWKSKLKLEL